MARGVKDDPVAVDNYFDYIIQEMKGNEEILRKDAKEAYGKVVELINDAIDHVGFAIKGEGSRENYVKRSMAFFIYHILMPSSYAVYMDLLMGNLPACFMELRLMLESLVKCYYADFKYPDQTFFQEKLELLENELRSNKLSTSKLMRELGEKLRLENDFVSLWGKLSRDWVHTKGILDRVVGQVVEKSGMPPWALVVPMHYSEADLDTVNELCKRISQLRSLLNATIGKYQQEFGLGEV